MFFKHPFESKYQLPIIGKGNVDIKELKNSKAFINYSRTIDDGYENLEYYNLERKKSVNSI